ncbi:MAG TPA: chloride channel protein [Mariprofundaceae bacterium]|nr:chloride channel protein [Mariprofundaceae bacterium]
MALWERLRKWQVKVQGWLHGQDALYLVLLAVLVGVLAGYAALLLRSGIEWVSLLWTGDRTWDAAMQSLPWYVYIVAPTVSGLLVGWFLARILPAGEVRDIAGVLADLVQQKGRINRKLMATESVGTAIAIGGGASLGREGPTVALGAVIASEIGDRLGLTEQQIRTLIGCGVAAGIAASFNTPIAGVLFALEVILADYTIATFSPIVISSVIATVITRSELGNFPAFTIPEFQLISGWEILAYLVIGIICGLVATVQIKSMAPVRRWFDTTIPNRIYRPAVAGLMVGVMGLVLPQVMSIGYGTVESMMLERVDPQVLGTMLPIAGFLLLILAGKLVATVISAAAGMPGGQLGPTLFLGATIGALCGGVVHVWFPAYTESYGAYALVACGAMTAAALQAPITTMLMIFEMTADFHIMLPLMVACSVAAMIKRVFGRESVFTEVLEERGIETGWGREQSWMRAVKVSQIPWRSIPSVAELAKLDEVKREFISTGKGVVQVVDADGLMVGLVTFADLQQWLLDPTLDHLVTAAEMMNRNVRVISENGSLLEAIRVFDKESFEQMPVVSAKEPRRVLGVLARNAVFSTYHTLIVKHGEGAGETRG